MPLGPQGRAWLELRHLPGVGPRVLGRAMDRMTDAEALLADPGHGEGSGLPQTALEALRHRRPPRAFHDDCRWLEGPGHHLVRRGDPGYPNLLTDLPEPPPLLYLVGERDALQAGPTLAIVGSRGASRAGRETARAFARDLAGCGFTIISGLARGIDAVAHRGALDGGGVTVAVQGLGLDRVYPAEHGHLAAEMGENVALIREFPVGTPPRPGHFPQRNRLISGLSLGSW